MKILDLFSGIGGITLGLEATGGFEASAFCETDYNCQQHLRRRWPDARIYSDIRDLSYEKLHRDKVLVDIVVGGFPCTEVSNAGTKKGLAGSNSGLWSEHLRVLAEVHPKWAIVENVSALRSRGLVRVLKDLSTLGYCCEWHCIPGHAVGSPQERDRIWIVAYTDGTGRQDKWEPLDIGRHLADIEREGRWSSEPPVCRVADGLPLRVDRLQQLGNAVIPAIPEAIGKAILNHG